MIKEAIEYIVGLSIPHYLSQTDEYGITRTYSDKHMSEVKDTYDHAQPLQLETLSSLVNYLKSNVDRLPDKMLVHVESPTSVVLYSQLDPRRDRETLIKCKAVVPEFAFNRFMDSNAFVISLLSKFIPDEKTDIDQVLQFAGTAETGTVKQYSDDGVSQSVVIKDGISHKTEGLVPSCVILRPFRSFSEIEQVESRFIFRMDNSTGDVDCALFEADGGAWRHETVLRIKAYLEEQLNIINRPDIVVIA